MVTFGTVVSSVTARVSMPTFPAGSSARTVKLFTPDCRVMLLQVQDVVPVQLPFPPRSFTHVTSETPPLSEAVPLNVIGVTLVKNVGDDVGVVMLTVGSTVSPA
jgi:hypothetical protein